MSSSDFNRSAADQFAAQQQTAEVRAHRRTTLVALRGEFDLATVSNVTDVLDGLNRTNHNNLAVVRGPDAFVTAMTAAPIAAGSGVARPYG